MLVGLLAGTSGSLDLNLMLRKRITIVGTTLRARPLEEKIAATVALRQRDLSLAGARPRPSRRRFGLSV